MEISQQTREFIRSHRTDDVRDLALHAKRTPDLDLPWALDQIAGWQTARTKLPQWADTDGIIYPPHLSMEQCSSEPTARYKAELATRLMASDGAPAQSDIAAHAQSEQSDEPHDTTVSTTTADTAAPDVASAAPRRGRLIDLTGGFGVDFSTMARNFAQAVYVERQPDLCAIARHNLDLLGLGDAQVVNADAASFLATADRADIIVIDPARRDEHGGRTFAIADCTPDILGMLDLLTAKAGHVLVKLSPMLDWHKAVEDCRGTVREVHIVAVANECKELLLVLRGRPDAVPVEDVTVTVHCVNITARGTEWFTVVADATGVHSVGTARHSDGAATGTTNIESANDGEALAGSADGAATGVTAGGTVAEDSSTTDADGDPGIAVPLSVRAERGDYEGRMLRRPVVGVRGAAAGAEQSPIRFGYAGGGVPGASVPGGRNHDDGQEGPQARAVRADARQHRHAQLPDVGQPAARQTQTSRRQPRPPSRRLLRRLHNVRSQP